MPVLLIIFGALMAQLLPYVAPWTTTQLPSITKALACCATVACCQTHDLLGPARITVGTQEGQWCSQMLGAGTHVRQSHCCCCLQ